MMVQVDVDNGAEFRRPVTMTEILAAGVELDAVTDADLGEDVCRIVCDVQFGERQCACEYRVEFLQASLRDALAERPPTWRRGSKRGAGNARLIEAMFTPAEREQIAAYRREYEEELEAEHERYESEVIT